jgi:hypothetical protein
MSDDMRRTLRDLRPTGEDARSERILAGGLAASAPTRAPDRLRPEIERTLSLLRPRPRWLAILKERPMRYRSHVAVGSPTARAAAVAAATMLVAILGAGALVIGAQPSPSPAPPELPPEMAPAWVAGTVGPSTFQPPSRTTTVDGVVSEFFNTTDMPIEMSDPRLSGTLSQVYTLVKHPVAGDDNLRVFTGRYRIENEGGSWEGSNAGMERGSGPWRTVTDTGVLVGSGAYEGLTAYLVFDWTYSLPATTVTGAIFPGDLPPVVTFEEVPR